MELLISLYDNALIYYPNISLPLFGLLIVFGLFFLLKIVAALVQSLRKTVSEINRDLKHISIKDIKIKKISEIKLSLVNILLTSFRLIITIISSIINALLYVALHIRRILKKIRKEILIEE